MNALDIVDYVAQEILHILSVHLCCRQLAVQKEDVGEEVSKVSVHGAAELFGPANFDPIWIVCVSNWVRQVSITHTAESSRNAFL